MFVNQPDPIKIWTLIAELIAKQNGRVAKDIVIKKKGEKAA